MNMSDLLPTNILMGLHGTATTASDAMTRVHEASRQERILDEGGPDYTSRITRRTGPSGLTRSAEFCAIGPSASWKKNGTFCWTRKERRILDLLIARLSHG